MGQLGQKQLDNDYYGATIGVFVSSMCCVFGLQRCVNSWGTRWGEDGMIKIRRGENESGIEGFVVGVWARVEKHDIQDRRRRRH